jgi:hypothetical protein
MKVTVISFNHNLNNDAVSKWGCVVDVDILWLASSMRHTLVKHREGYYSDTPLFADKLSI